MQLIEVAFKGNRKDFFLWEPDDPPPLKTAVIVDADRGEDLGVVHALGELAQKRNAGTPHGYGEAGTTKKVRRLATPDEVQRAAELRALNEDARRRAMERVKANALVMKLSDAEWQWDRKKLTLYFTADKRVDFRTLVRELASMFRTRIELKQIGVRDEAKRLDGIGRCGRQYCSASWLPELRPVNLGVAKDQRLSLNPSQISGACGRLMCCLRYEHEFYVHSRKRFPKEGRIIKTKRGEEKVISNDIFRERVVLRGEDGEVRTILLTELRAEAEAAGAPLPVVASTPQSRVSEEVEEVDDILLEGEEEIVSSDVVVADELAPHVVESVASPDSPSADARERRPNRRRGRRGGRRNRPGGRGPGDSSSDSTPPSQGGES
ncbi:MAG TPA: regulatory iron-sulfur-containing complex subunit RicT [Gemmatimonadaceae bacterium]|nr:regulatory iron-sulfur-containing complex subunit RicT [Gemmatimonadaceae bacterium]